MLTIAFLSLSFSLSALGVPHDNAPHPHPRGIPIALTKRTSFPADGIVDPALLTSFLDAVVSKYENGFESYMSNTGAPHPLSQLTDPDSDSSSISASPPSPPQNQTLPKHKRATSAPLQSTPTASLWSGPLSVGTPPQPFTVQFDTGSADIFLPGPLCTNAYCTGHTKYVPAQSASALDSGRSFVLVYGTGEVRGRQWSDSVAFGDLVATKQAVGAASSYSSGFQPSNFPPDGLLGLASQPISRFNSPPFFQSLLTQQKLSVPIFSFKLTQTSSSELLLGGVNPALYTGAFTWAGVTTRGYWQVLLGGVNVNGTPVKTLVNLQAVIDTGTTYILAPARQVQALYASIPGSKNAGTSVGSGFYTFPCSATPTVSLSFGGKAFGIDPGLFNLGRVNANSGDCVGAVVGSSFGFWVVGDTFLQGVYSTFDVSGNRVGFADLAR